MAQVPATAISISRIKSEIEQNWQRQNEFAQKTVESILKIGQLLLKADAHFRKTDDKVGLLEFESGLPFSKSTASKYRRIASNDTLADKTLLNQLPASIHSLYELSQVAPKDLRSGIKTGAIGPDSDRLAIADFTGGKKSLLPAGGGAGRPRKANKTTYEDLLTLKIDKRVPIAMRTELISAISKLADRYPEVQCIFSKSALAENLKELRAEAEAEFERLQGEMAPQNRFLVNLVDRALEAARRNGGIVPIRFEWRQRLHKELGIDISEDVRMAKIFKAAREKGIVSRFLPLKSHSEVIKTHILVMNYCDGKASALKLLKQVAEGTLSKTAKDRGEARRIAKAYLATMPWVL